MPTDFLAPYSLSLSTLGAPDHVFIEFKDVSFVQSYTPDPATTGVPRYYATFDVANFILAPTPNANFFAELHYYGSSRESYAGRGGIREWNNVA